MRRVATGATLGFHGNMLVDKRALLIDVTFPADGIATGQGAHLADGRGSVGIMAIAALDQALIHTVMKGFGEIGFGGGVAAITKLRLAFDQQLLLIPGMMRRMAIEAADLAAGMGGFRKMRLLVTVAVAG